MKNHDLQILTFPKVKKNSEKNSEHLKYLKQIKTITHDLNNVLTNISNGVRLAKNNTDNKLQLNNLLTSIENNAEKASNIINEITNKNNPSAKDKKKLNLETIIDETIISVKDSLHDNIKIEFIQNALYNIIFANYTEIYRLLLNLLINANDALEDGGKISIEMNNWTDNIQKPFDKNNLEYVVIKISDNGKGISKENLSEIFTEGFSTKNKNKKPSGLGLAIVKEIIENHNGFIKVESQINKGTSFEVYLPVIIEHNEKISFANQTVIIAEDDFFQREVLKDLLTSLNLKVLTATNGIDVLNLYNKEKTDLIIVDNNMPEMNGIECINELRRTGSNIPIILSSGYPLEELEKQNLSNGISGFLLKPYNFEAIQNLLLKLLV